MTRLAPALEHARAVWRQELEYARATNDSESLNELEGQRVTVFITYEGPVPDLREAGVEPGFDSGGRISGSIAFPDLDRLDALDGIVWVEMQPRVKPLLDGTVAEMKVPWKNPGGGGFTGGGRGVIIGVIDTGIDIFHESFIDPDGKTRILELWDQTPGLAGGSNPPAGFAQIGKVYSWEDINATLAARRPFASTDTGGHGTHVAGTAAGSGRQDDRCSFPGRYVGVAPEADLVIVKALEVPNPNFEDALIWCAQAGTRHPGNKPVVVNCSFGHTTGPHDGTDPMDASFDKLLRPAAGPPAGIAVVASAGNAASEDIHESGTIQPGNSVTIPFYLPNGSYNRDVLDIWYNGTSTLSVEVIAPPNPAFPGKNRTDVVLPSVSSANNPIGGMMLFVTSTDPLAVHNNKRQIRVGFEIKSPVPPLPPGTTPPKLQLRPGVWQLKLTHTAGPAAVWDAWFSTEHGDSNPTFRIPDDPSDPVTRRQNNTITSPGTSRNVITIAAYSDDNGELADFSSHGASNQAGISVGERKPTVAAPGVAVAAPRSRDYPDSNSSCCDQKVIDMKGTSMASPHVAGLIALMLEKNPGLTFEKVREHLQHSARIDGIPTPEVPPEVDPAKHIRANALWGSGKVDALMALNEVAAPSGGGGGGGGGGMMVSAVPLGFTPHTLPSRLSDWRRRFGDHPGVMLFAGLVSEHVDEVLWLVNNNRRVLVTWRRGGGHLLARRLLYGPPPSEVLIPREVEGHDVGRLLAGITALLSEVGGARLKYDLRRFADFVRSWPGATLTQLDQAAVPAEAAG